MCRLHSLGELPWLPSLQALYLQDNGLTRLGAMHGVPSLTLLNLASNPILHWRALAPVLVIRTLRRLDLNGCPLEQTDGSAVLCNLCGCDISTSLVKYRAAAAWST